MTSPVAPIVAPSTGPLTGIRVIDLTATVLGPYATQTLGDMGADVIKIEPPSGDVIRQMGPARHADMAAYFIGVNRNKRSVVLDLKKPRCIDALMRLLETADVFVHSMRPAAAERLGLGYEAIAARNPRIIYGFAPGYRSDGPYRDRPAFDDIIQGEAGLASLGPGEPRFVPTVVADKLTGATLASAIGMALFARERSGKGQRIEVPMFETLLSFVLAEHLWGAVFDPPEGQIGYVRLLSPHRRPYATQDGHICIMPNTDAQWRGTFNALDCPGLVTDPRFATLAARTRNFDALLGVLSEHAKRHTTDELRMRLDAADVPNGALKQLTALLDDPYVRETGFLHRYEHPTEGAMVTTSIPVRFSDTPGNIRRGPPNLGEHTLEVLREAGLSDAEIAALH